MVNNSENKKHIIRGIEGFTDNSTKTLEEQLAEYTDTDRQYIEDKLQTLEQEINKTVKILLPNGNVPIYLSPTDTELNPEDYALWSQYNEIGPYAQYDDAYCRENKDEPNKFVYPIRNPITQDISLKSCDKLINSDILSIADIVKFVPTMQDIAKAKFIEYESSDQSAIKSIRTKVEKLITEYESLDSQHGQILELLDQNKTMVSREHKIKDKNMSQMELMENQLNIKAEDGLSHITNQTEKDKYKRYYYIAVKTLASILIIITIGLVLLINIGKIF